MDKIFALHPAWLEAARRLFWGEWPKSIDEPLAKIGALSSAGTQRSGSVLILPISGVIRRDNVVNRDGVPVGFSTDRFVGDYIKAMDDSETKAIVLYVDSPGGDAAGMAEASDMMMSFRGRKPVVAVAKDVMASGGYYYAVGADEIVSGKSSSVGSVGAYTIHFDLTGLLNYEGVKAEIIRTTPLKAAGHYFEPLSDGAREELKTRLDATMDLFVEAVANGRGITEAQARELADGRLFVGSAAVRRGFADRIGTLPGVVKELAQRTASTRITSFQTQIPSQPKAGEQMNRIKKYLVNRGESQCSVMTDGQLRDHLVAAHALPVVLKEESEDNIFAWLQGRYASTPQQAGQVSLPLPSSGMLHFNGDPGVRQSTRAQAPNVDTEAQSLNFAAYLRDRRREEFELKKHIGERCVALGLMGKEEEVFAQAASVAEANVILLDLASERQSQPGPELSTGVIDFGHDQVEKQRAELKDTIVSRAFANAKFDQKIVEDHTSVEERKRAEQSSYRFASLFDLATACMESHGVQVRGRYSRPEIAMNALGVMRFGYSGLGAQLSAAGYHTTGGFANITLDAMNKTVLAGYQEFEYTWRRVFREAEPTDSFKDIHRMRLSEAPNLDAWDGMTRPNEIGFRDEKETYHVDSYANIASITWKMLVNDDMDAFGRIPRMMGTAAARKVNSEVWRVVTSNPTLQDGQPLFLAAATGKRLKPNLASSGASISVTTLSDARKTMRTMRGVNKPEDKQSDAIIDIQPRYLCVPAAVQTTAEQVVFSQFDPAANTFQKHNPFSQDLEIVTEPNLDDNSADAWYLFADTSQVDTLEVTFLQGQQSPVITQDRDFDTLALKHHIMQTFGVKAIDFRGAYKNPGT